MPFKVPEMARSAKGGTELMQARLEGHLASKHPELLEFFNFHCSRLRDYDENKPSVYWVHDLAEDPEAQHLRNGGWQKFDLIVFVSNWQYQQYQERFGFDGSNCIILNNGIERSKHDVDNKWKYNLRNIADPIRLIYHTTPHRGLEILVPAFIELWEKEWQHWPNPVQLDVYSSFSVYGWGERDAPYEALFQQCRDHPAINYHGAVSHEEVQEALAKAHIFAYPCIWKETSCLALIEAMHAECHCIHPNLGALIETSGGHTIQYPFKSDPKLHLDYFKHILEREVKNVRESNYSYDKSPRAGGDHADAFHMWDNIANDWVNVLTQIKEAVAQQHEIS